MDQPWGCETGLSLCYDPWKIKRVLTATDVDGGHNRLFLGSKLVRNLVLPVLTDEERSKLDARKRVEINFCDVNNNMSIHTLILKKWKCGRIVVIGNWNRDFVRRRGLNEGDQIGLQWDEYEHRFNFSVLRPFP
ncbi:hypothetical protein QN277_005807 [Acacia crassicarpa]|uniref:B3 domain-containing protein n=1 Tax=Acacia crassicarpa TaxID=499986 RepID=A0AAE1MGR6_9FABA|nr:hypothetical protein QN277_005807 [Acacia crassicarpa]